MAEAGINTKRVSALATVDSSPVYSAAGLVIEEKANCAMVQVFVRSDCEVALATALGIAASPSRSSINEDFTALPLSPGQWMLTSEAGDGDSFCQQLRKRIGALGYASEQSHGRVIIRVSGNNARELMQKGCRLDLHKSVAGRGFCAQTPIAQVGVLLHQIDDEPAYDLHIYSGFAQSFWQWLTHSAAQFGSPVN